MIDNPALENILENATDLCFVIEFYHPDAVPGADGFDPADALLTYAASDVTFRGI